MSEDKRFTDYEPAWGGILRRFPIDNVPAMDQGFRIITVRGEPSSDGVPRETVLEWEPVGPTFRATFDR